MFRRDVMKNPGVRLLTLAAMIAMLGLGCAHRGSVSMGYWDAIVLLTEAFEADPEAAVPWKEAGLSKDMRKDLDTNKDGLIVRSELWAHQEQRAARPYAGPKDYSEASAAREGGFPLNVDPEIVTADEVELGDDDLVMGLVIRGEARAYPVNYMNGPLNEVVNDNLGGEAIASTW